MCIKLIFNGHMESLIKNLFPVSLKFEPGFLTSVSCLIQCLKKSPIIILIQFARIGYWL